MESFEINLSDFIAFFSFVIALITFTLYMRDRKREQFIVKSQFDRDIIEWYGKTTELLILLKCHDLLKEEREKCLANLSSQIEIGRFYFPNINKNDNFGGNKPSAYQGYRNLVLDFLVYSYNILKRKDYKNNLDILDTFQREYTSIVFNTIKPNQNIQDIRKITNGYIIDEKIFEDYLKSKDPHSIRAILNQIY